MMVQGHLVERGPGMFLWPRSSEGCLLEESRSYGRPAVEWSPEVCSGSSCPPTEASDVDPYF